MTPFELIFVRFFQGLIYPGKMSQQGSLRRISSLGALGEGSGWDLRIRPAPAPAAPPPAAASGNLGAIFLEKKRRLRQRTHKFRASRNLGAIFLKKKKAPAATYPQTQFFQKYEGHFSGNKNPPWALKAHDGL